MPVLKRPRRERFAQLVAKPGELNQAQSYIAAGYRMPRSGRKKLNERASALRACPDIASRIAEIQATASAPSIAAGDASRLPTDQMAEIAVELWCAVNVIERIGRQLGVTPNGATADRCGHRGR